jgi:hypothetical protein
LGGDGKFGNAGGFIVNRYAAINLPVSERRDAGRINTFYGNPTAKFPEMV